MLAALRCAVDWLKTGYQSTPSSYRHVTGYNVAADIAWAQRPGKALEDDGLSDEPSPHRDDATAAAARRLLDFHMGA